MTMDITEYPHKHKPFDHQRDILERTWKKRNWALFMEMGTGKSKIAIDTFCMQYLVGAIKGVLVVAKKGEYANWVYDLLPEHVPESIDHCSFLFGTYEMRLKRGKDRFAKLCKYPGLRIMVVNIEAFTSNITIDAVKAFYKSCGNKVCVVVDESTCIKNHKSKRSKALYQFTAKSVSKRVMTGTPIAQSPLDVWGQTLALDKGLLGCASFTAFRSRYAIVETMHLGSRRIQKIDGYKNQEELHGIISRFADIMRKDDCLDLPPKIYKKNYVTMTPEQDELYQQLKHEAMAEVNGHEINVTNALALMTKLHQVACGQLKIDDETYTTVKNNRLEALMSLLEDGPEKVIIWANYRQTLWDVTNAVRDAYGAGAVGIYYGGVSADDRQAAIDGFQKGDLRYLVGNPQSMGYSFTLTAADTAIYYSNSFHLERRLQSEDRNHRISQDKKCVYIDLVTRNTVDEKIIEALRQKKNVSDEILHPGQILDWI